MFRRRAIVIALVCSLALVAADSPPPGPKSEEREQIKDLRIEAYAAALQLSDKRALLESLERQAAETKLDIEHRQSAMEAANKMIGEAVNALSQKYSPDGTWCVNAKFEWTKKAQKELPCSEQKY